jgi:glycosyltransferase involved in cell wall biosynthesis
MRIALVADAYPPSRTSAAVQMHDLAQELAAQGHEPTVLVPASGLATKWEIARDGPVQVLRLRAPRTKDITRVRRAVAEFVLPYSMSYGLSVSPLANTRWDGVIWYSPTIFFGAFVRRLKAAGDCKSYLILRDLFPDWAVDTGVMRKGLAYGLLKLVQQYQYSVADVIGVQTPGNLRYLRSWVNRTGHRVEVLYNWLAEAPLASVPSFLETTRLRGRTLFVYAGNMGPAQDVDAVLSLALKLEQYSDLGFLFVGRGTEAERLRARAEKLELENVEFHDEIEPSEVPGLLSKCHVGIVALDPRHRTHNIPGKFLTYMYAGLPVLARINPGNDLEALINNEGVGRVCTGSSIDEFEGVALDLWRNREAFASMSLKARQLARRMFSVRAAACQLVEALKSGE